jgi:hypothetical protein
LVPTLSNLSHKARRNPVAFLTIAMIYGWLTHHIFFEKIIPALESIEQTVSDLTDSS